MLNNFEHDALMYAITLHLYVIESELYTYGKDYLKTIYSIMECAEEKDYYTLGILKYYMNDILDDCETVVYSLVDSGNIDLYEEKKYLDTYRTIKQYFNLH